MRPNGERPFSYVGNATAIAAGASAQISIQIDTDADFVIERRDLIVTFNAASGGTIVGTPFPYDSSNTLANNTAPTLALVRIDLRTGGGIAYQNGPINAKGWVTRNGETYPVTKQRIGRSETLLVTIYNDSAVAINAQVLLEGKKLFGR